MSVLVYKVIIITSINYFPIKDTYYSYIHKIMRSLITKRLSQCVAFWVCISIPNAIPFYPTLGFVRIIRGRLYILTRRPRLAYLRTNTTIPCCLKSWISILGLYHLPKEMEIAFDIHSLSKFWYSLTIKVRYITIACIFFMRMFAWSSAVVVLYHGIQLKHIKI